MLSGWIETIPLRERRLLRLSPTMLQSGSQVGVLFLYFLKALLQMAKACSISGKAPSRQAFLYDQCSSNTLVHGIHQIRTSRRQLKTIAAGRATGNRNQKNP